MGKLGMEYGGKNYWATIVLLIIFFIFLISITVFENCGNRYPSTKRQDELNVPVTVSETEVINIKINYGLK